MSSKYCSSKLWWICEARLTNSSHSCCSLPHKLHLAPQPKDTLMTEGDSVESFLSSPLFSIFYICSIIVRYNMIHVIYYHILKFDIWFWCLQAAASAAPEQHHCFIHSPSSDLFLLSGIWTDSSLLTVKACFHHLPPCLPPPLCFLPLGVFECFWGNSRSLAERSDSIIDLIDAARQILDLWQCLYLYTSSSLSSCSSR